MVKPIPAIEGYRSEEDGDVTVISTGMDSVSFIRGLGDSGQKIQVVEHDCPQCEHPTMLREIRVSPKGRDTVGYWCNNPHCRFYHRDNFSYAFYQHRPESPVIERYD